MKDAKKESSTKSPKSETLRPCKDGDPGQLDRGTYLFRKKNSILNLQKLSWE